MEYNSNVFAEILSCVESPEPDPDTGRVTIPPVIQPVIVPGSVTAGTVSGGGIRGTSHFCDDLRQQAGASGGTSATLTTLRRGIWRITGTYQYVSSVIAAPAGCVLRMVQAGAAIGFLAAFIPHTVALAQGIVRIDTQLTLNTDTDIVNAIGATGAGERIAVDVVLHCQRIA